MSERSSILKAIRAGKDKLDEMRRERLHAQRERNRARVGRERTEREGFFVVRDSAPPGVELSFSPFSATVQTIYRKGFDKPVYRSRESNRFISRATAAKIRGTIAAKTAYNTVRQRFPDMTHEEARGKVNRLTELSARRQLGEEVDIEIADIFGYPT